MEYKSCHSFLKEVESYSKIEDTTFFIRLLGISRDDNTQNYIMIMEFATLGSLYEYFKSNTNSMAWETKIKALYDISLGLNHLHDKKRPTSKVLYQTIEEWYYDIRRNRNSEFTAQIKRAEEISEDSSTYNTLIEPHYKTHPNAIYSSRLLNFANLSPPVNSSSFDQQLKKLLEEGDCRFMDCIQNT
ncbi:8399_t:CDS:2 [Gigaspora margarita]|uniref:8399_t:CDS:1 n=1 Tax=Gigaspora margarita TaxID=4874 RepID=A0ABN7UJS3_GIGMA|nr:8399_t:CDS:2 [Gigaspora margarita]